MIKSYINDLQFLSTPSVRRATTYCLRSFFPDSISIHALREEGDESDSVKTGRQESFLSTPSVRRATAYYYGYNKL